MKNKLKSILCALLALAISVPVGAVYETAEIAYEEPVAPDYGKTDNEQPTTAEMEAVIKKVKPLIDVPAELSEFMWDYYGGNQHRDPYWTFIWSTKPGEKVYRDVSVTCDKTGKITNYNNYDPKTRNAYPKYTKAELTDTAKAFIKKIAPDANLFYVSANDASGRYSGTYTYNFKRMENGIDYPDNTASVSISNVTGEITSASVTYDYGIDVVSSEGVITPEKAAEILGTEQKMELSYALDRTEDENGNVSNKAILVYKPAVSYISVDAKTGEIYFNRSEIKITAGGVTNDKFFGSIQEDAAESENGDYRLTEEELEQLEVLKKLITREQAIKKITDNKNLYLDVSLSAISADLSRLYDYSTYSSKQKNDKYVWNISFSNPVEDGKYQYYYAYANARVDAQTGEILSFDSSLKNYRYYENAGEDYPSKKFTEQQTKDIFEGFVKQNIPEKFASTVQSDVSETNTIFYKTTVDEAGNSESIPQYGAYRYNYTRVNEGVKFDYDTIYGGVDAVTGKIYSFGYSWTNNLVFESPKDVIGEKKALEIYLDKADFDKYYERYDEYVLDISEAKTPEEKTRALVVSIKQDTANYEQYIDKYAPEMDKAAIKEAVIAGDTDSVIRICAKYFGVEAPDSYYFYNSLDELYNKKSVARLVYKTNVNGVIIGAISGKRVTHSGSEYEEAYTEGYTDIDGHWAQEYITLLADMGILVRSEKFLPDEYITLEEFTEMLNGANFYQNSDELEISDKITRLEAVRMCIDSLGYSKIASLENIYKTEFSDNPDVPEKYVGYLAIAWGFGIIEGYADTNTFRPDQRITRAEAVKLIAKTVEKSY